MSTHNRDAHSLHGHSDSLYLSAGPTDDPVAGGGGQTLRRGISYYDAGGRKVKQVLSAAAFIGYFC